MSQKGSEARCMPTAPAGKVTCYSGGEGAFMDWSQALRGRWFAALLSRLAGLGVTANHLTLLSLLAGLSFGPLFLWVSEAAGFASLLLHVFLDGLDGPLARLSGEASSRGSLTDTLADQVVVTTSTLTMVHAGHAGIWPAGVYLFLYLLVVAFALVRNALAIPYSWLLRPRFPVYAWFVIEIYGWPGSLDAVLCLACAALGLKALTGFLAVRRRM